LKRILTTLIGMALIAAVPAIGAAIECNGTITTKVNDGLFVGPGDACDVEGTIVNGGIYMTGGKLRVCGSTINGSVKVTAASSGPSCPAPFLDSFSECTCVALGDLNDGDCAGNTLNGPVSISGGDPYCEMEVGASRVEGNLSFSNNAYEAGVDGNVIYGSLACSGNYTVDNDGEKNTVFLSNQCFGL
jgi:hypothetical protein